MTPSLTAQGVARARARMARPSTRDGDPAGEQRLNIDLGAESDSAPGPMFHHLAARTAFFDSVALAAIDGGTNQIVIVGAGYDCRALRFRQTGVQFYELDHPATQLDKQQRLARLGVDAADVAFVPIDLASGSVDNALSAAGHDADRPSLVLAEGLLLYLDLAVIERLFAGLRDRVHGDAVLALSIALRDRVIADPAAAARRALLHQRLRGLGEPPRTTLGRAEWESLLRATGWAIAEAVDPHSLDPEATAGGSLLVTVVPIAPRADLTPAPT